MKRSFEFARVESKASRNETPLTRKGGEHENDFDNSDRRFTADGNSDAVAGPRERASGPLGTTQQWLERQSPWRSSVSRIALRAASGPSDAPQDAPQRPVSAEASGFLQTGTSLPTLCLCSCAAHSVATANRFPFRLVKVSQPDMLIRWDSGSPSKVAPLFFCVSCYREKE